MIKIFTDKTYLTQEYRKIIFPVLLDIHFLKTKNALDNFQLIDDIEKADVVIVPVAINYFFKHKKQKELNQFIDKAIAQNKKVVGIDICGDGSTMKGGSSIIKKFMINQKEKTLNPSVFKDHLKSIFFSKSSC